MNKKYLLEHGIVRTGEYTLKSGQKSNLYFDCRMIPSYPRLWDMVTDALIEKLSPQVDFICGVPFGGLPFASSVAYKKGLPMIFTRKDVKPYGTSKAVEGRYRMNSKICIIDDVITTGKSMYDAAKVLEHHGLEVIQTLVIIDRYRNKHITSLFEERDFRWMRKPSTT